MHISKFRIHNYKSYLDSGEVILGQGINIITGQNNAGKTALLQALSLDFKDKPHKSIVTIPNQLEQVNPLSSTQIEFNVTKDEFKTYIFNFFDQLLLPKSHIPPNLYSGENFFDNYLQENNSFNVLYLAGGSFKNVSVTQIPDQRSNQNYVYHINKKDKTLTPTSTNNGESSFYKISSLIKERVYIFHAERLNIGQSKVGVNKILNSDASNLPEVLNILQGDLHRFERYNKYVRKIFPQIFRISVRPKENNNVEIVVWNQDPKMERSDLIVPLYECGTGLGQVLAILYVVLTSDIPKIIIIDEPNSFLHPGACRKLIEILKEHPQHQFIISTHSPSTIAAANPKTINIVRSENAQSFIESIDVEETNKQELYLAEIGAKLSDVFGADNILWVEGKTEEICFPKIIENTKDLSLMGTSVLGVKNTGDFQNGKTSELIFDIYNKLSTGKGLIPPAVSFVFDKENLKDTQIKDLARKSKGMVKIINRMMYENYLLNPSAIFNVLNSIEEIKDLALTEEKVNIWIEKNKWNIDFISVKNSHNKEQGIWLEKVNAAVFLSTLFNKLTNKRVNFDKIKHSVALTEWILENSIDDFKELQELLTQTLNPKIKDKPIRLVAATDIVPTDL